MLHGCRSDLILNRLVNSKKGRNLYSHLLNFYFYVKKIFDKNIEITSDV